MTVDTVNSPRAPRRWFARPRGPHRLGLALLLAVSVGLTGLALGEWLGWPFLAAPLQRVLSSTLHRQLSFSALDLDDGLAPPAFALHFLGGLQLSAPQLEIAAPDWSQAPYLLRARGVVLSLRYQDVWRAWRGQPLRVRQLQADQLDAHLQRLADGRASWLFGASPAPAAAQPQLPWPVVDQLQVSQATLTVTDAPLALDLQVQWSVRDQPGLALASASASAAGPASTKPAAVIGSGPGPGPGPGLVPSPGPRVMQGQASGHFRQQPVRVDWIASGALLGAKAAAVPVALRLHATAGRATLAFDGQTDAALDGSALSGHFSASGPSLAAVGDPVGVTLPTTAAFRGSGVLVKQGALWRIKVDDATVGTSRLNGAFLFDTRPKVPLLSGRLGGSRLMLADLAPVVGAPVPALGQTTVLTGAPSTAPSSTRTSTNAPAPTSAKPAARAMAIPKTTKLAKSSKPTKVLPSRPFDLAALRVMDANVLIALQTLDLNTPLLEPLRPLRAHLQLQGGVLTVRNIDTRTALGQLRGELGLDGRTDLALWTTDLRWSGLRLERWIHQARATGLPPYVSGQLHGRVVLAGQGRSTADILGTLKGSVRADLRGGAVSHLAVEVAGLDLAQSLGVLLRGDRALAVPCAVADLVALHGVLRPRVMVLDSSDSTIWFEGSLSLADETLDLRAVVAPKDFSPLALRAPLRVTGSFASPQVSVERGPLARKLAGALLLALVNPLAALIPLVDLGDEAAAAQALAGCQGLIQRRKSP